MRTIAQIIDENKNKVNEENIPAEVKKAIQKFKQDMDKLVKSMDLGDFAYKGCDTNHCYFGVGNGRWYEWHVTHDYDFEEKRHHLTFDSIASYGTFDFGDDTYKFYKSVGVVLAQEDALHKMEELFENIRLVIKDVE